MESKRIAWIDTSKAFAILLVIVGHTVGGPVRAVIFSFHMALFFILSAWTTKFSKDRAALCKNTFKSFRHLFVPALLIFSLRFVLQSAEMMGTATWPEWKAFFVRKGLSLLFSSGVKYTILGVSVPELGIPWFLVVLFFSKTIYDVLQLLLKRSGAFLISVLLLSLFGVFLGRKVFLFFSLDIALAVLPFLWFAQHARKHYVPGESVKGTLILLSLWILCFILPILVLPGNQKRYLEFASRDYPLFPVCYAGAICATLFVSDVCARINSIPVLSKIIGAFNYLGHHSLYMIYVHCFDQYWKFLYSFTGNAYINSVFRVAADIIAFIILMKVRKQIITHGSRRSDSQSPAFPE